MWGETYIQLFMFFSLMGVCYSFRKIQLRIRFSLPCLKTSLYSPVLALGFLALGVCSDGTAVLAGP